MQLKQKLFIISKHKLKNWGVIMNFIGTISLGLPLIIFSLLAPFFVNVFGTVSSLIFCYILIVIILIILAANFPSFAFGAIFGVIILFLLFIDPINSQEFILSANIFSFFDFSTSYHITNGEVIIDSGAWEWIPWH